MRKLSRNKKAVSNVIGTILMILVVAIGMSIAFNFFVTFVKNYQAGSGSSVMELVSIEDVWFRFNTGGSVTVWLYNYGKVAVTMSTFYVNGVSIDFNSITIPVGEHNSTTVQVNNGNEWTPGATYVFKFVTERGSVFKADYTVPSVSG
jgi:flagellin-like protein